MRASAMATSAPRRDTPLPDTGTRILKALFAGGLR